MPCMHDVLTVVAHLQADINGDMKDKKSSVRVKTSDARKYFKAHLKFAFRL